MIYKEPGNVKIHRLRVIHLFENDLNFLLGIKWGQCLHKAQASNHLHPGQYGSRPGRDPHAVTLMEELRLDYSLLTRTPFCNFDNDASSCYDRILLAISSLAARGLGMHRDVVFIHATTLAEAEYKLKLGKTVSTSSYKHCIAFPLHGSGQGSTASPMIWCFISCKLFQCHQAKAHGMLFTSPQGDVSLRISIVGFVDDATCITGGDPNKPIQDLLQRMQHDAQLWNDLLWTSGGKLELPKCGFHAIYYRFDDQGLPVMVHDTQHRITISNAHNEEIPIREKNIFTPRKNLGHYKAPASRYIVQTAKILEKAHALSDAIAKCDISRTEAKLLYDSVFRPAVEYPIPQSFLSRKQLTTIEQKTLPQIFAKCGYMRNTSRKILFGPAPIGGGGFIPLYAVAGAGYVQHFLKHWRTPKEQAGRLVRIVLAWSQYQAGVSYPILHQPDTELPYMQGRFIPALRRYLSDIGGSIAIHPTYAPAPLRRNDRSIMEYAMSLSKYTDHQLKKLNSVRMFLGITFLSEITNLRGTHIMNHATDPTVTNDTYILTVGKIYQPCPPTASWVLWQLLLAQLTTDGTILRTPLGSWTSHHSDRGTWPAYYDPRSSHIFHRQHDVSLWDKYDIHEGRLLLTATNIEFTPQHYHRPVRDSKSTTTRIAFKLHPCDVRTSPISPMPSTAWKHMLAQQPAWVQRLLVTVNFGSIEGVLTHLRTASTIIVVSDGSARQGHMTFGWIASRPNGTRFARGCGPCDGRPSSLRSEAAGMLAATLFFALLHHWQQLDLPSLEFHFYADNMELIQRQQDHKTYIDPYPNATLKAEFDLVEQIYLTIQKYQLKAIFRHVKGHQDDKCEYKDLSLESQLNVDADALAAAAYSKSPQSTYRTMLLPSCPASLSIRDISITNDYNTQLVRAFTEPAYIGYLQDRFHWSNHTTELIAWKSLSCALRRIQRPCLTTKICNDLLPVAVTLKKWRHQPSDRCCLCGEPESKEHLFTCNASSRIQWRIQLISALRRRMTTLNTNWELQETFCSALTDWLDNQHVPLAKYPSQHHNAIITQTHIGWRQLFMGKMSQEWETLQGHTLTPHGSTRPAFLWSTSIIETLLTLTIDLWETRNAEVHGKTAAEQNAILLPKYRAEIIRLRDLQPRMQSRDTIIFDHVDQLLSHDRAVDLADWITTNRPLIYASIKKAHSQATSHTPRIYSWFPPLSSLGLARIRKWTRDRLIFDPFSKKKRHKEPSRSIQTTLTHNLSLRQIL